MALLPTWRTWSPGGCAGPHPVRHPARQGSRSATATPRRRRAGRLGAAYATFLGDGTPASPPPRQGHRQVAVAGPSDHRLAPAVRPRRRYRDLGPDWHASRTNRERRSDSGFLWGGLGRAFLWGGGPAAHAAVASGVGHDAVGRSGRSGPFAWVTADLGYGDRQASVWRAWPSARVARRPPGEWRRARRRSGLAGKGKELLVPRCIRRPMAHPPGPTTCTAVRGAPPLRKKVVNSQRTTKARRSHSLPLLAYSRRGGLRQDPGRAAESAAGPRTDEDMGARRACVVVDLWGTR